MNAEGISSNPEWDSSIQRCVFSPHEALLQRDNEASECDSLDDDRPKRLGDEAARKSGESANPRTAFWEET